MSLGIFKRVAHYKAQRRKQQLRRKVDELLEEDSSSPSLPLNMALYWREFNPTTFSNIPTDLLLTKATRVRIGRLDQLGDILGKVNRLIGMDDYDNLMAYLNRIMRDYKTITISEYLSDAKGFSVSIEEQHQRISRALFEL